MRIIIIKLTQILKKDTIPYMDNFKEVYEELNDSQKIAVDAIDGPLMVLAGPGTGKTQLLSARVANILDKTDADASNILCLTFTESGAQNMRTRLRSFIGDMAFNVTINTYHSFGNDIIKQYSDYFQTIRLDRTEDSRMERPIDELTQYQIVEKIIGDLPFDSPLLSARYYIKSVSNTISDLRQNLITPDNLQKIAYDNLSSIKSTQDLIDDAINSKGGLSRKKVDKQKQYDALLEGLANNKSSLAKLAYDDLVSAFEQSAVKGSPTPLTKWKNIWLHKNDQDYFSLTDPTISNKMIELARVYETYLSHLKKNALYDFDDMILRTIDGLKNIDELRYNLQERYQYILLDEFQDTNPSQFELVKQIADHPVHEGRPNIMAVGDDDQAIYAFQGANIGNMTDFIKSYRDVKIVNLTDNYRSHSDIIHLAEGISGQISNRLHSNIKSVSKKLISKSDRLPESCSLERVELTSEAGEYSWIANNINDLIAQGVSPDEIAVLAPRHKILENLVPFLNKLGIPMKYDKRENILETEIISGLRLAAQLVRSLLNNDTPLMNQLFPVVLGLPYWQIKAETIWKANWQLSKHDENRSWAEIGLENDELKEPINLYLSIALASKVDPLEVTLDKLIGVIDVHATDSTYKSPLKDYYFDSAGRSDEAALKYYEAISHLSVIRTKLREYQTNQDEMLTINEFTDLFDVYEATETPLTNTHPIAQSDNSVNLMTAYKAKGLEFDYVYILQANDDVWGEGSRGNSNKLSLPINLGYIRYKSSSEDERLRLLFVAITRARHGLFITSHTTTDSGKELQPVKYLNEAKANSPYFPENYRLVHKPNYDKNELSIATETMWQASAVELPANFRSLLHERLLSYKMSPTHLNNFIDVERGGPESFLMGTILRFPQAPSAAGEFGTSIHNTLEWYQNKINSSETPAILQTQDYFSKELNYRYLSKVDHQVANSKGREILSRYLQNSSNLFQISARAEVNFFGETIKLGNAIISGKIDRLEIDESNKSLRVVDYKTGEPLKSWAGSKGHKYKQQLYFYKFLLENSTQWKMYEVLDARLEFIQPAGSLDGPMIPPLVLNFDTKEEKHIKDLVDSVWNKIQSLDLPDISGYPKSLKGIKSFETDLLKS